MFGYESKIYIGIKIGLIGMLIMLIGVGVWFYDPDVIGYYMIITGWVIAAVGIVVQTLLAFKK